MFGVLAIALVFVGYVPYIRDILRGKTHPHAYSWLIWIAASGIIFALQVKGGAGAGAFVTLAAALVSCFILALGLKYGESDITKTDTLFLILAIVAASLWLVADRPVASNILLITTEALAFVPTIRKSWHKPYSETLSSFALNTLRFCLALVALRHYNLLTALYPVVWAIGNGIFCIIILSRRRVIPAPKGHRRLTHDEPGVV